MRPSNYRNAGATEDGSSKTSVLWYRIFNPSSRWAGHVYVAQEGHEQPLYRRGNGIPNVLYLCARVLKVAPDRGHVGGLIVVDEPESGLHPDLHRRLMKLAATIYKDYHIQWVMGTHSPYLEVLTSNWCIASSRQKNRSAPSEGFGPEDSAEYREAIRRQSPRCETQEASEP